MFTDFCYDSDKKFFKEGEYYYAHFGNKKFGIIKITENTKRNTIIFGVRAYKIKYLFCEIVSDTYEDFCRQLSRINTSFRVREYNIDYNSQKPYISSDGYMWNDYDKIDGIDALKAKWKWLNG